ncbi:unnamed protein product [Ixodes pacificus]
MPETRNPIRMTACCNEQLYLDIKVRQLLKHLLYLVRLSIARLTATAAVEVHVMKLQIIKKANPFTMLYTLFSYILNKIHR